MKTISTNTRREQYDDYGKKEHREGGFMIMLAYLWGINLVLCSINFLLLDLNVSFFWDQNQTLETMWVIVSGIFYVWISWYSLGKNLLLTMWGFLTTLMILFVPILILLLKGLALIYGF